LNPRKLSMSAADGALVGSLLSLTCWKLSQPRIWQIITGDDLWFGPWPLLGVAAAVAIAAGAGAGLGLALHRMDGVLPIVARWGLLILSIGLAAWIGMRAVAGRGPPSEIAWADQVRADLEPCGARALKQKDAPGVTEWVIQSTKLAECAKLEREVGGAEEAGHQEADRGGSLPAVSKVEREYLDQLMASMYRSRRDAPPSAKAAREYAKDVQRQAEKIRLPTLNGRAVAGRGALRKNTPGRAPGPDEGDGGRAGATVPVGPATTETTPDAGKDGGETSDAGSETVAQGSTKGTSAPVTSNEREKPPTPGEQASGGAMEDPGSDDPKGGLTPFETIAGTAACLYIGAPPAICEAAIALIDQLLGGLFSGGKRERVEEATKLMGAIAEFAGSDGSFATFDSSTFEQRFLEFGFNNPEEGLDAFIKVVDALRTGGKVPLDEAGVRSALERAKALKSDYDRVLQCVKVLHDKASANLRPGGLSPQEALESINEAFAGVCSPPLSLRSASPEDRSAFFQKAAVLNGEEPVTCAFAIAASERGVSEEVLKKVKLPTADLCPTTQALLSSLGRASKPTAPGTSP